MQSGLPTLWLIVENDDDDFYLVRRAFTRANSPIRFQRAKNGLEAKAYLRGEGPWANREVYPLPSLILSDVKMPAAGGLELLAWIKQEPLLASIPFVLLTNSNSPVDREQAKTLGVADYLVKPLNALQ